MVFIETHNFTKSIRELITDDNYAELQKALSINPAIGTLIEGTGGLRKVRWKSNDKGKRGGIRIIYYWHVKNHQIVVARLEDEVTVKRFYKTANTIELRPENPDFKPIIIPQSQAPFLYIEGVVVGLAQTIFT